MLRKIGKFLERAIIAIMISALPLYVWATNYTVTQGSGTTFASIVISAINYPAHLICDATNGSANCAAVKAGNTGATTDQALIVADPNVLLAVQSAIPAGTNNIGNVGGFVTTVGGWTPSLLNGLSSPVTAVKSSAAGQLAELYCYNPNSSVSYVQVFDVATAGGVSLGSTTPVYSYGIPATTAAGKTLSFVGGQFSNGIQVAATTTVKGSTAPTTALDCTASFK